MDIFYIPDDEIKKLDQELYIEEVNKVINEEDIA